MFQNDFVRQKRLEKRENGRRKETQNCEIIKKRHFFEIWLFQVSEEIDVPLQVVETGNNRTDEDE